MLAHDVETLHPKEGEHIAHHGTVATPRNGLSTEYDDVALPADMVLCPAVKIVMA